jgi:hypothetical protein
LNDGQIQNPSAQIYITIRDFSIAVLQRALERDREGAQSSAASREGRVEPLLQRNLVEALTHLTLLWPSTHTAAEAPPFLPLVALLQPAALLQVRVETCMTPY